MTEAKIEPTTLIMIEKIKHITKITNNSDLDVIVSYLPKKPKRKYKDFLLLRKGYVLILRTRANPVLKQGINVPLFFKLHAC